MSVKGYTMADYNPKSDPAFTNPPANQPNFKEIRPDTKSSLKEGDDYFFLSPEKSKDRERLVQTEHTMTSNLRTKTVEGSKETDTGSKRFLNFDFFERISSLEASNNRYVHNDFDINGTLVVQQDLDALRLGVAAHEGSHPQKDLFLQNRIDEMTVWSFGHAEVHA